MRKELVGNERVIWILKTSGPQPLNVLAAALKMTTEGARFQLIKLVNEGLVEASTEVKGRGRPQQVWALTAQGHARFPDTHAELTVRLIRKIKDTLGEDALDKVIAASAQEGLEKYSKELAGAHTLEDKVKGLAAIRNSEGYMAEYTREGDEFFLIENHCPICAAATECQGFCQSELTIFKTILGEGVTIARKDHIPAGARRCAYHIKPYIV